jgi:hypothetical protein
MAGKVNDLAFKGTNIGHIRAGKVNVIQLSVLVCEKIHPSAFRGFTFNSAAGFIKLKLKNFRTGKVFAKDIIMFRSRQVSLYKRLNLSSVSALTTTKRSTHTRPPAK